jgi:hypothetical protein
LPAEVRDYYERIRTEHDVVLVANEVRLAEYLANDGLGIGGDLRPGKRFWPVNLHASATSVRGGHGWVNELYAEISFCRATGCKCSDITWRHCGERFATFYGAVLRLEKEDRTCGSLTVYDDGKCSPGSLFSGPAVGQIVANNLVIEASGGLGTRLIGTFVEARWWSMADAVRAARPCADEECTQGADRLHLRLPRKPPVRDELAEKTGAQVAFTMTSIGMVDQHGRRPIERPINGVLPAGWKGPHLD